MGMGKKQWKYLRAGTAAGLLAASLLLGACGSGARAASMHLRRTEGLVEVRDEAGKEKKIKENLGLYSGYQVETQAESYGWIDLDQVKLAKMDQNSQVEVQKEEEHLEIQVKSGSMYFHVSEPLGESESMNIISSTMMIDIRGTCGWAEVEDERHMNLYLLEGAAKCSITAPSGRIATATAHGGEVVRMSVDENGEGSMILEDFKEYAVPSFVLEELREDEALCDKMERESGLRLFGWSEEAAFLTALEEIRYLGDPAECTMTQEQKAAFARVLREEIEKVEANFIPWTDEYTFGSEPCCYAGLVDVGGNTALMFGSGMMVESIYGEELWANGSTEALSWGIWEYIDGEAVLYENLDRTKVYSDYLFLGGHAVADPEYDGKVYFFENGRIAKTPGTAASGEYLWSEGGEEFQGEIDGRNASQEQMEAWQAQWEKEDSLAGYSHGSDVSVTFWGLAPAKSVLSVLEGNGPLLEETEGETARIQTTSVYDPGTHIRHTDVNVGTKQVEIFYEIPVFEETTDGYQKINTFFQAKEDAFLDPGNGEISDLLDMRKEWGSAGETFYDGWSVQILSQSEQYVCIEQIQDYHAGGPHPWMDSEYYTFRVDTGEQVYLSDVADAGEEEITAFLLEKLEEMDGGNGYIFLDEFQGYGADDYGFYIGSDGKLYAAFSRSEGAVWASGGIKPIELPWEIRQ